MFDLCFIGLGNPGTKYDQTKHNIGKDWLVALSQELNLTFEPKKKFESSIASSHEGRVLWVVPDNYVNNSGSTVKKIIKNNNKIGRFRARIGSCGLDDSRGERKSMERRPRTIGVRSV